MEPKTRGLERASRFIFCAILTYTYYNVRPTQVEPTSSMEFAASPVDARWTFSLSPSFSLGRISVPGLDFCTYADIQSGQVEPASSAVFAAPRLNFSPAFFSIVRSRRLVVWREVSGLYSVLFSLILVTAFTQSELSRHHRWNLQHLV